MFAQIPQHDLGYMELGPGDFLVLFLILTISLKVGITISHLQLIDWDIEAKYHAQWKKSEVILGSNLSQVSPVTKQVLFPELLGVLRNSIETMAF